MTSSSLPRFELAPELPRLRAGEVHLWRAALDDAPPEARETLSASEWIRAGRFHFERDRERFISGRGLLRMILGGYLEIAAEAVPLASGPLGKPELPGHMLRFNLSHSDELMLLAVTYSREVGVDVEFMRPDVPFEMLAEHYFAPQDAWDVRTLPAGKQAQKFYDVWTRTEAQLKAGGAGLVNGTKIIHPDRWSLRTLTPADGYAAALAVEGGDFELTCLAWPS